MMKALDPDWAAEAYRRMVRIRVTEEKIASVYPEQQMKCPVHLHIGQEAVSAGVALALDPRDRLFASHRSHGPYLALGGDLLAFFAELYGKAAGCSGGRGGSMHLQDRSVGYWGSSAIVAGTIPIGVGAALALKLERQPQVAVVFFGDGAVDEGVFYESLNFAALKRLPMLFICENNGYATQSSQELRQAGGGIVERAQALGVTAIAVDGNDVEAVCRLSTEARTRALVGGGPTLIEAATYRQRGHVGPGDDLAHGYRDRSEYDEWLSRDPIDRFEARAATTPERNQVFATIRADIEQEVEEAHDRARRLPDPEAALFLREVFS